MPSCVRQSFDWVPVLFALTFCACGSGGKPPESANEVVPLDNNPGNGSGSSSSAGSHSPSPDVNRAMKAIEAKEFAEAKAVLTKAVAKNSGDVLAHYYMGVACGGLGENTEAASSYKQAIELDPKFAEAYVNLSALQLDLKERPAR